MTPQQLEEKKKEFFEKFCFEYKGKYYIDSNEGSEIAGDDLWSWIESLVKQVEQTGRLNGAKGLMTSLIEIAEQQDKTLISVELLKNLNLDILNTQEHKE